MDSFAKFVFDNNTTTFDALSELDVVTLKNELDSLTTNVGRLDEEIRVLRGHLDAIAISVELNTARINTTNQNVQQLTTDVEILSADLRNEVNSLANQVSVLTSQVDSFGGTVTVLQNRVTILENDFNNQHNEFLVLNAQVSAIDTRLSIYGIRIDSLEFITNRLNRYFSPVVALTTAGLTVVYSPGSLNTPLNTAILYSSVNIPDPQTNVGYPNIIFQGNVGTVTFNYPWTTGGTQEPLLRGINYFLHLQASGISLRQQVRFIN